MVVKQLMYVTNLINIAYRHNLNCVVINDNKFNRACIKYLYKYNFIKLFKYNFNKQSISVVLNYFKNKNINYNLYFFKTKQKITLNKFFLNKLKYNYLFSCASKNHPLFLNKNSLLRYRKNGKILAILF